MSTLKVNTLEEATSGGATYFTAKAWVTYQSQTTTAILDSANVSSITDNGTGDFTINFSNGIYSYCPCASLRTSYKSNLAAAY